VTRYDVIGAGYARTRHRDPDLAARIDAALGDARTVVDVGAGTGSYEPAGRHVVAIEPSDVMAAQRPRELAPAIRAYAAELPLRDDAVDAAQAVLTIHHWGETAERGVRELRRVARGPVVIVTFDAEVCARMWVVSDYLPEVGEQDRRDFPTMAQLAEWLGAGTRVETVPVSRDTPDWTFASSGRTRSACSTRRPATPPRGSPAWTRRYARGRWRRWSATSPTAPGTRATVTSASSTRTTPACGS
jgi:SAM-dependent methyltransferase